MVLVLASVGASLAQAAPSKARRITRIEVLRSGAVQATLAAGDTTLRLRLAQISTVPIYAARPGCGSHATDYDIAQLADSLGLANAVDVVPEPRAPSTTVYLAKSGDRRFAATRSLNVEIVRSGLAKVRPFRGTYRRVFLIAQSAAKKHRRGIWSGCRSR